MGVFEGSEGECKDSGRVVLRGVSSKGSVEVSS